MKTAREIESLDDIEMIFRKQLASDPIVSSIWKSGEHHGMTVEQRLKWMVSVFCELRNEEMQRKYDEIMSQPFNPYFLRSPVK